MLGCDYSKALLGNLTGTNMLDYEWKCIEFLISVDVPSCPFFFVFDALGESTFFFFLAVFYFFASFFGEPSRESWYYIHSTPSIESAISYSYLYVPSDSDNTSKCAVCYDLTSFY